MEVFQFNFLRLKTIFKNNFYFKICRSPQVQSDTKVAIEKYFWNACAINVVLLDLDFIRSLVPKLCVWPNGVYINYSDNYVPTGIYDIFKFILSILFIHFYLKYMQSRSELKKYKWLVHLILYGVYIGIFTIDLMLSYIALIKVPITTFGIIKFVILLDVSYLAYYTACTTDWFDKYIHSMCYTYTSTVNHNVLKDRQYLILSNLATRWHTKNVNKITQKENKITQKETEITQKEKEITQKEKKIVQSAPQDPRLNRDVLVNKGLNNIHSQLTSLNTSQSLDGKDKYLISNRIVRPDSYYDQSDTSAWGKSELNEYTNKLG